MAVGAWPRLVDVGEDYAIDVGQIERALYLHTPDLDGQGVRRPAVRAIMPVWWHGMPPNLPAILTLARRERLLVIEDACPGVGADYDGRPLGSWGDAAAVSLHPLKQLNVWGDGGVLVTNDESLARRSRLYRNHGMANRNEVEFWGVNTRLHTVQAVVANHLLDRVSAWVDRRIEIADRLDKGLGSIQGITVPPRYSNRRHAYQIYCVNAERRDELIPYLMEHGVETKVHYPIPLHMQPAARYLGHRAGDFPVAERQAYTMLSLPCHQFLRDDEVEYIVEAVRGFYGGER